MSAKLRLLMSLIGNCLLIIRAAEGCESFTNVHDCKAAGCEYSLALGACQSPANCNGKLGLTGCRRAAAFYGDGGVISRYTGESDNGNCVEKETILAVNMARSGVEDSRGIEYIRGDRAIDDPDKTIARIFATTFCPMEEVTGIDFDDDPLFNSQFIGKTDKWAPLRCIDFRGIVPGDGVYELNIKTVESRIDPDEKPNLKRYFNILINKMPLVAEFNIREYVPFCEGMELIFEFQVVDNVLTPSGFLEGVELGPGGDIEVSFCYGEDGPSETNDPGYLVSAFNVVAMEGLPAGVRPSTCTKPPNCRNPQLDGAACEKVGCELNTLTGTCGKLGKSCDGKTDFLSSCRRELSYYALGGQICLNKEKARFCPVKGNPLGCHYDYYRHSIAKIKRDCRGVVYRRCSYVYQDLSGIPWSQLPKYDGFDGQGVARIFQSHNWQETECKGARVYPESNADCKDGGDGNHLYFHPMTGIEGAWAPGKCFEQRFKKDGDGVYEISIKTAEYQFTIYRGFDIKVNGMTAVKDLNIKQFVEKCVGIEIIIEFEIRGRLLTVSGFRPTELPSDDVITLGFCYGDREPRGPLFRPTFMVAAYYIGKIQN